MNCIAIDDEPPALKIIASHISKISFLDLRATFYNAIEASKYIEENKIDLIFLDINMPDLNGFQFLETISYQPLIIFTTAYPEFALESYEKDAIDYLLKPFQFERFLKAVNKAEKLYRFSPNATSLNNKDFLFLKSGYQHFKINFEEILYVEGAGNYMAFVTEKRKVLPRMKIQKAMELLPLHDFFRIHKSFIVALQHINKIEDNHVLIRDNRIPIGANYKEAFFKFIKN